MPPKKKKGKAKKAKTSKAKVTTPWDDLDTPELQKELSNLTNQYNRTREERIQLEKEYEEALSNANSIQSQVDIVDDEIQRKTSELERTKERQANDVAMYEQKMTFLKYVFEQKLKLAEERKKEIQLHQENVRKTEVLANQRELLDLKEEIREKQIVYNEEIRVEKERLDKELLDLESALQLDLQNIIQKCKEDEKEIEAEFDLKQFVVLREMTEQMNMHIMELKQKHKEQCEMIKSQYERKVSDNAKIISDLVNECDKVTEEIRLLEEESDALDKENKALSGPLHELTTKVNLIKKEMKDEVKVKQSLKNSKSMKSVMKRRIELQKEKNMKLQKEYDELLEENSRIGKELLLVSPHAATEDEKGNTDEKFYEYIESIRKSISTLQSFIEAKKRKDDDDRGQVTTDLQVTDASNNYETNNRHDQHSEDNFHGHSQQDIDSVKNVMVAAQQAFSQALNLLQVEPIIDTHSEVTPSIEM